MFKVKNILKPYIGKISNIFFIIKDNLLFIILLLNILTTIYFNKINIYISLLTLLYILLFKRNRFKKINYKDSVMILLVVIVYIFINYVLGIKFGFLVNPLKIDYVTYIIFIIILELSKYILINEKKKIINILIIIIFILWEINFSYLMIILDSKKLLFIYLLSYIIPIIFKNILISYIEIKSSFISVLIFIIVNSLYLIFPMYPNVNWLTNCMLKIIELFMIYCLFKKTKEKDRKNSFVLISYALTFIFATLLVCFMLGLFKYKPITVLSNSMSPSIDRGDVIIYKRLNKNDINNLPLNSIIVFDDNNRLLIHRITSKKIINNITYYETKGDNNIDSDSKIPSYKVVGIYKFKVKYLGYPSIWLYEFFN